MKMTKESMTALGFLPQMPAGNATEPWWVNEARNITFFGIPTLDEFFAKIEHDAAYRTRQQIGAAIRSALML